MWIARNKGKNGTLTLFKEKPVRSTDGRTWVPANFDSNFPQGLFTYLTDIKDNFSNLTWEDEPIEVDLFSKDDKFKLIEDILDYVNRFGMKDSSASGIYEFLLVDVIEK